MDAATILLTATIILVVALMLQFVAIWTLDRTVRELINVMHIVERFLRWVEPPHTGSVAKSVPTLKVETGELYDADEDG